MVVERKIRIAVEATVAGAKAKLRSVTGELRNMSTQGTQQTGRLQRGVAGLGKGILNLESVTKLAMGGMGLAMVRMAATSIMELGRVAAKVDATGAAFEALAARQGMVSSDIVKALKTASRGTIDEYSLIIEANKALRLGVATTVEDFENLMKIAMVRAREMGLTVREAWGFIVTAIGRASPMIADNLGILLDATATYDDYADSIGKSADELDLLEKKEALRGRILREGIPDIERWNELGEEAIDIYERQQAELADLRVEIGRKLQPATVGIARETSNLLTILEQLGFIARGTWEYITEALQVFLGSVTITSKSLRELAEEAIEAGRDAGFGWARAALHIQMGTFQEAEARIRAANEQALGFTKRIVGMGRASQQSGEDVAEAAEKVEKAADIWQRYLDDVAEANRRFADRVEDAQWRATQAAERAAFQRYELERDAEQRRGDLIRDAQHDRQRRIEDYQREQRFALERHQADIRRLVQDHNDRLADLEYDFQQEKRDLLDEAPWWIRQALSREFAERERIRAGGDREELREYDQHLLERIRAIDPVYAEELERLQEQYDHRREIEDREHGQTLDRAQETWDLQRRQAQEAHDAQLRELEYALGEQLALLERELADQREAWEFRNQQRLEDERRALDELREEHRHQLDTLIQETENKLSELALIWTHYGSLAAAGFMAALQGGLGLPDGIVPSEYVPPPGTLPGIPGRLQGGMPYVPYRMQAVIDPGEAVLPVSEAERWRRGEGGITIHIENLTVGAGVSPFTARYLGEEIGVALGEEIRARGGR